MTSISVAVRTPHAVCLIILLSSFPAEAATDSSFRDALTSGMPLIDVRLRHENVEQANRPETAEATTVRARLGYQTGAFYGLTGLAEFDVVEHIGPEHYNNSVNGLAAYPVIADPDLVALNRLQFTYATRLTEAPAPNTPPDLRIVLGRQRLILGDARFVGNSAWRQHEQTFDALSVVNTSLPGLAFSYAYVTQVNRVFGEKSPSGTFDSHSHLLNAVYTGLMPRLKLEGYAYFLDLRQAPTLSTETFGLRAEGAFNLGFATALANGAYAHQSDYVENPQSVSLDYHLLEGGVTARGATLVGGWEVLEGNGALGFSTPLATLHIFQGWADVFLTTPANGIDDRYVRASYGFAPPAVADRITATLVYHDFRAERLSTHYGDEWDAQLEALVTPNVTVGAKYADFDGDVAFPDKTIFWLYASYRL